MTKKSKKKPARKRASASLHSERFPGECKAYRAARDKLLKAEMELRKRLEEVAAMRRKLPLGGLVSEDYEFEEGAAELEDTQTVRRVRLSELLQPENRSLVVYSFMYGPKMAKACPMCTSILDGLNGTAPHAAQRINLAVVAKSPIQRIREYARGRGWRNLRLLSSAGNSYNQDYRGERPDGSQWPCLNVFVRRDGNIYHTYSTELMFAPKEPGQDFRHVDLIWPLWNLFDYTPEGRGTDWRPKLSYGQ
ncbi:MAG TPA: DUF899 family protein [Burkholderiales bacterium]|nr:DUF899 family protein [Burkholderiales bacterium]